MKNGEHRRGGVISRGITTPVIKQDDDLQEIVISAVMEQVEGGLQDGDIIGITEAVVAISQGNFCSHKDISDDIQAKFPDAETLVVVDPIQSRNRFMGILEAIAKTPTLDKIYIVMTYPADEVGNRMVSDAEIIKSGVNLYEDYFTANQFYTAFGVPKHPFTGKNYIEEYEKVCNGKASIILCNNFSDIPWITGAEDFLICSIHRREEMRAMLENGTDEQLHILDLSDIMNEPVNGSGYNKKFGLYGTNLMHGDRLKLMPRNCQEFVEELQAKIYERYGKRVEALVYGDGAFKDPVGGIWELADPTTTLGATCGLKGTPKEVKLKLIASEHEDKSAEEIADIVARESAKRKILDEVTVDTSLGTTPRQITDLVASLADLTTGSGDRQTPVVHIRNYL